MQWYVIPKTGPCVKCPTVRWTQLINPIWWFGNDREPDPPPWYTGGRFSWYLRNPLQNFGWFVIGYGNDDFLYYTTNKDKDVLADVGQKGWVFGRLYPSNHWLPIPRPFVSYSGEYVAWYVGWQRSGFAGVKYNVLNSDIQVV